MSAQSLDLPHFPGHLRFDDNGRPGGAQWRHEESDGSSPWDNAVVENFFATLKTELIYRRPWQTKAEVKDAIVEYIAGFYNCSRRHSFLDSLSPIDFERAIDTIAAQAA